MFAGVIPHTFDMSVGASLNMSAKHISSALDDRTCRLPHMQRLFLRLGKPIEMRPEYLLDLRFHPTSI